MEHTYADTPVSDVPEIIQAEARLADVVGSLNIALDELERKLERVLRPNEMPGEDGKLERRADLLEVREARAPMSDFLHSQSARLEMEVSRVNDLFRRIAL